MPIGKNEEGITDIFNFDRSLASIPNRYQKEILEGFYRLACEKIGELEKEGKIDRSYFDYSNSDIEPIENGNWGGYADFYNNIIKVNSKCSFPELLQVIAHEAIEMKYKGKKDHRDLNKETVYVIGEILRDYRGKDSAFEQFLEEALWVAKVKLEYEDRN